MAISPQSQIVPEISPCSMVSTWPGSCGDAVEISDDGFALLVDDALEELPEVAVFPLCVTVRRRKSWPPLWKLATTDTSENGMVLAWAGIAATSKRVSIVAA
jgi:hypothetical protein